MMAKRGQDVSCYVEGGWRWDMPAGSLLSGTRMGRVEKGGMHSGAATYVSTPVSARVHVRSRLRFNFKKELFRKAALSQMCRAHG